MYCIYRYRYDPHHKRLPSPTYQAPHIPDHGKSTSVAADTRNCVASWWYSRDTIFVLNLVNLGVWRWRLAGEASIKCFGCAGCVLCCVARACNKTFGPVALF
jgi:hypothetical protein